MREKKCGIYKIENLVNGKTYVGQSIDIHKRWREHKSVAFGNRVEKNVYPIYKALRKYGIDSFNFEILEECKKENLLKREIYYYDNLDSCYNVIKPMTGTFYAKNHSEETKAKIKKNNARYWSGKKLPQYMIENIICGNKTKRKSVRMLDKKTGKELMIFESIKDALLYVDKNTKYTRDITRCCDKPYYRRRGSKKIWASSAYGYRWEYNK